MFVEALSVDLISLRFPGYLREGASVVHLAAAPYLVTFRKRKILEPFPSTKAESIIDIGKKKKKLVKSLL